MKTLGLKVTENDVYIFMLHPPKRNDPETCQSFGKQLFTINNCQQINKPIRLHVFCPLQMYDLDRILTGVMTAIDGLHGQRNDRLMYDDSLVYEAHVHYDCPKELEEIYQEYLLSLLERLKNHADNGAVQVVRTLSDKLGNS